MLKIFEEREELEFIMTGSPLICLEDWKENTIYKDSLTIHDPIIKWFWEVMEELD